MIKAVVFDWNGTLSDDTKRIYSIAIRTTKKVGGKPISFSEFRKKVRNPWYPFYRDDLGCKVPRAVINRWFCYYAKREKIEAKLFSDAIPLLEFLKDSKIKIGIVSSYPEGNLGWEIKIHKIGQLLDFVRGGCHTKADHLKDFLKMFKLKPKEVIFVGDMVFDIVEGKKCKVFTAAFLRGADCKEKLEKSKPDFFLQRLSDLKKHI
jgi:phosphoglycolate phosphatase-like HAD superfamily hydrolase